jgi:RNA polymerase sigma factor (sigma-70 family)
MDPLDHRPARLRHRSEACSDRCLIEAAHGGDEAAFAILFLRHRSRALSQARWLGAVGPDAEDAVGHAFAHTFVAIRQGGGPSDALAPYLRVAVRNAIVQGVRSRKPWLEYVEQSRLDVAVEPVDPEPGDDSLRIQQAFNSLSASWRVALWKTAVEGLTAKQAADELELSPNAVSALSMRARNGLRQAFLDAVAS